MIVWLLLRPETLSGIIEESAKKLTTASILCRMIVWLLWRLENWWGLLPEAAEKISLQPPFCVG